MIYDNVSIWSWSLERRLEHAEKMYCKTLDQYPGIAAEWEKEILQLQSRIAANTNPGDEHVGKD